MDYMNTYLKNSKINFFNKKKMYIIATQNL